MEKKNKTTIINLPFGGDGDGDDDGIVFTATRKWYIHNNELETEELQTILIVFAYRNKSCADQKNQPEQ